VHRQILKDPGNAYSFLRRDRSWLAHHGRSISSTITSHAIWRFGLPGRRLRMTFWSTRWMAMGCRRSVRRGTVARDHGAGVRARKWQLRTRCRMSLVLRSLRVRRVRWRAPIQGRRQCRGHWRRVRKVRASRDGGWAKCGWGLRRMLVVRRRLGLFIAWVIRMVLIRRCVGRIPLLLSRGLGVVRRRARHDGRGPRLRVERVEGWSLGWR
jgi:hypothetical protein